jgi:hypothetical protein
LLALPTRWARERAWIGTPEMSTCSTANKMEGREGRGV